MIVATAGHVDHGKTTLVRALTGVDTDRLAEEQRRGMTIDLGFAYADLDAPDDGVGPGAVPGPVPVGFVDVPGHERFVRNMLAGVAAVDLALLVVAADDGPMPQTAEHLAILGLLGVPRLVVALSKVDRVGPAQRDAAAQALATLLAGGPYAGAPVFDVAAPSGQGLDALRQHLARQARAQAVRPASGQFRMVVDRSFTVAGAGRVVTGAVLSGAVRVGDAVCLSPAGVPARVRSLQAQHRSADSARAGQRCALNLAGPELKRAEPERGDWVLAPAQHAPGDRLDVWLQALDAEAPAPSPRATLQLHLGAAVRQVRVLPLGADTAAGEPAVQDGLPGRGRWAQLQLDRPVAAACGDRFVLRDPAANRTLAGGCVVDPAAAARGRLQPQRLRRLAALARPDPADALAALLADAPQGVDLAHFAHARNLRPEELDAVLDRLPVQRLDGPPPRAVAATWWAAWRARLLDALARGHARHPEQAGLDEATLRRLLADTEADPAWPAAAAPDAATVWRAALAGLVAEGQVLRAGLAHRLPGHRVVLAAADQRLLAEVDALLRPAGLRPPIVGDLAQALGRPLPELLPALERLARHGLLVRVAPNRWYLPETVDALAAHARALAAESDDGGYDAAGYRDRTGIGRNLTVQVLEFLDRAGVTRFDGLRHRLRG